MMQIKKSQIICTSYIIGVQNIDSPPPKIRPCALLANAKQK